MDCPYRLPRDFQRRLDEEELLARFERSQAELERQGVIPRSPAFKLRTHRRRLELAGAILVGGMVSVVALLLLFVVLVMVLHIAV